jgi:hypothetical protein
LDQIQFLLGHVSIQTTERYLGCKQELRIAVNNRLESSATPFDPDRLRVGCFNPPWAGIISIRQVVRLLPGTLPRVGEHRSRLSVHWPVLIITALACTAAAILFSLAPAMYASGSYMYGIHTRVSGNARHTRSMLVGAETALALVLLVGTSLFVRTFIALHTV